MSASASSEPEFTAVPGALPEIRALIKSSRRWVVATANLEMVVLYWNIGRIIAGDGGRATHGKQLVERLAVHLARQYGRGFSSANPWAMRRFYDAFVIPQTVSAELAIGSALLAPKGENAGNERIALDFEQHIVTTCGRSDMLSTSTIDRVSHPRSFKGTTPPSEDRLLHLALQNSAYKFACSALYQGRSCWI